jgi:hypothetical protein
MLKFYTTGAPDSGTLPQFNTVDEAVAEATKQVQSGIPQSSSNRQPKRRYVVAIVAIVEEATPPVKVTYLNSIVALSPRPDAVVTAVRALD